MKCSWCRRLREHCRVLIVSATDEEKAICEKCVLEVVTILEASNAIDEAEATAPPQRESPAVINLADVFRRRAELA